MSTRWYPLYQRGNPQLRVFLPNFWMKLVAPDHKQPPNIVQFQCSMEMTIFDVQNYLEKIYKVYPVNVRTRIAIGRTKRCRKDQSVIKEDDVKIAYVTLSKNEPFTFPTLFPATEEKDPQEQMEEYKKEYKKFTDPNKVPGLSSWFRIH